MVTSLAYSQHGRQATVPAPSAMALLQWCVAVSYVSHFPANAVALSGKHGRTHL